MCVGGCSCTIYLQLAQVTQKIFFHFIVCSKLFSYIYSAYIVLFCEYYASINVSPHPPLPGEVRQSRGFDLIRIKLPHPPGKIQIQIPSSYTGSDRGFDAHVYEWHEPVLLNRYKRERNPAQSAGQAS